MRADQLLVERGMAASRSQATRLIAGGLRWRDGAEWRVADKSRTDIPPAAEIELVDAAEARYVSRGGLKLAGALSLAGVDPAGMRCLDVGQSTGGFTDCLLQHGARHVTGVDVGHGQLHARLRSDVRVTAIEKVNARSLVRDDLGPGNDGVLFDLIVGDLSFISLTLVLPALVPLLDAEGQLLMLIKPQFELQPGQVGKGGIVRDPVLYQTVEARLRTACSELGLCVLAWFESLVRGGDGNLEFFMHAALARTETGAGREPSAEL
ncbi:MAG: TlyA family RNA methyltransferase [Gammaproteobacteria bacterium]|nr:TlyA family RNA methyltransferase [Gammaproteobacteria bacterium]MBU1442984.1 TlyA family RNA methyltransferase [Gammaproteobacteria bacterium]